MLGGWMEAFAAGGMEVFAAGGMEAFAAGGMEVFAARGMEVFAAGGMEVFAAGGMVVLADENSPGVEAARGLVHSSGPGVDGRCAGMVHVKSMFSCSPSTYANAALDSVQLSYHLLMYIEHMFHFLCN